MGESLNPSILSRVSQVLRPDWSRTVAARRAAAGALVVLAGITAVRSDPAGERIPVVVASRDLAPGTPLTADDVHLQRQLRTTVPDGSRADIAAVVGSTLAGPVRRGEVLTDVRLLGARLARATAGPDARIVPLHLADTALLDLVRPGDVVDVLAAGSDPNGSAVPEPHVVATGAVVVLASPKPAQHGPDSERVMLVALPASAANTVAGTALTQSVTITFH